MKNIASKKITQKIFLIVLIVLLLNGFVSNYSMAQHPSDRGTNSGSASKVVIDSEITEEDAKTDGGTLLTPIKKLGYTLADAIMSIVQKIVIGNKYSYPVAFTTPATKEGDYWDDLGDDNINIDLNKLFNKNITISSIKEVTIDGNTYYYIIDSEGKKYSVSIKNNPKLLPFLNIGDNINVYYLNEAEVTEIDKIEKNI